MVTMYQDILTELTKETGMEQRLLSECPVGTTVAAVEMREARIQLFVALSPRHLKQGSMSSALWYYYSNVIIKERILKLMFVKKVKELIFSFLKPL